MVAFAKNDEKPQEMRAYMYKLVDGEVQNKICTINEAELAHADGWRMTPIEFHPDETIRNDEAMQHAAGMYCRDWNMQLNLHLLTDKHQVVGLAERCLKKKMNPKMSKNAMKREFERIAKKMGVWMGDE